MIKHKVSKRDLEKLGAEELAIKYGVHPQTAWKWKKDYKRQSERGEHRRQKSRKVRDISQFTLTPEMVSDLFLPERAFAEKYDVPIRVVKKLKRYLGIDPNSTTYVQDFCDASIRNNLSWEEIMDLHTLTYRQLQEKYGWSSSTIAKYRKIVGASTNIVLSDCTAGLRRKVIGVTHRSDKYWEKRRENDLRYRRGGGL